MTKKMVRWWLVAGWLGCAVAGPVAAQVLVNGRSMTLEQVDLRISAVEMALIKAQGDRFRSKQAATYGDPDMAKRAVQAGEMESRLIELRRSYDERVQILDADLRKKQGTIEDTIRKNADMADLVSAIEREIELADRADEVSRVPLLNRLNEDLATTQSEIARNKVSIQQMSQEVLERKKEMNASDAKAGELAGQIKELEAQYSEAYAGLQTEVDDKEQVKLLDQQRQALVKELQALRDGRQAYLKQEAAKADADGSRLNLRVPVPVAAPEPAAPQNPGAPAVRP